MNTVSGISCSYFCQVNVSVGEMDISSQFASKQCRELLDATAPSFCSRSYLVCTYKCQHLEQERERTKGPLETPGPQDPTGGIVDDHIQEGAKA